MIPLEYHSVYLKKSCGTHRVFKKTAKLKLTLLGWVSFYAVTLFKRNVDVMTVTEYLESLIEEYRVWYPDYKPPNEYLCSVKWTMDGKLVDTGLCFRIARLVEQLVPGAKAEFIFRYVPDYLEYDENEYEPVHCAIEYQGRYYDTSTPAGVDCIMDLDWFKRNKTDFPLFNTEYNNWSKEETDTSRPSPFIAHCAGLYGVSHVNCH